MTLTTLKIIALRDPEVRREYDSLEAEFKQIERSIENDTDDDDRV